MNSKIKNKFIYAIIVILPYLTLLMTIYRVYQQYRMMNNPGSYYYEIDYNEQQRIEMLWRVFQGACMAVWIFFVYQKRDRTTMLTILVNITIMILLVFYPYLQPNKNSESFNLTYAILYDCGEELALIIGLELATLGCLLFFKENKQAFQAEVKKLPKTPLPPVIEQTVTPVIEEEILIQPLNADVKIEQEVKAFEKPKINLAEEDDERWKP